MSFTIDVPKEFIDAGEAVVMPYQFRAHEPKQRSGALRHPRPAVFWLRDGMIIRSCGNTVT